MSEGTVKKAEPEGESQEPGSLATTPSDVRLALKELASAVAEHDVETSPEVDKALEGLAFAMAGREPTRDDRRALLEFASDIGFSLPEEQDGLGEAATAGATVTQGKAADCASLLAKIKALLDHTVEAVASRKSGQELIRQADSVLKVFELTAVWEQESLPEKPMPWIVLIPMVIAMKVFRCGLGLVALALGYNSPSLRDMIRFIRRQRRNLRALKYTGVRNMRHMKRTLPESEQQSLDPNLLEWLFVLLPLRIISRVSNLVGFRTIQRPAKQVKRKLDAMLKDDDEGASEPAVTTSEDHEGHEEEEDLNLTLTEQLDLYADDPSDEDSDYEPPENHETSSDGTEEEDGGPVDARPPELSPIPSILIDEPETDDEQENGNSSVDTETTVVADVSAVAEDSNATENAALSCGRQTTDDSYVSSNPDPAALSYGSSPQTAPSSSDESGGTASRSLLSKFLGNRRHKTPVL